MTRGRTPRGATRTFAKYDDRRRTRYCIGYGASLLKERKVACEDRRCLLLMNDNTNHRV